jgi:GTP-binding protein
MKDSRLIAIVGNEANFPKTNTKEIAICGRSNCGKSSLINTLFNTKKLAHTSSKPGKTITINFFKYSDNLSIVDLPGYGYAKVSFKIKDEWGKVLEKYFNNRKQLKKVMLLIDVRREITVDEINFIDWLNKERIEVFIIFTKIDKLNKNDFSKKKLYLIDKINSLWQDTNYKTFFTSSMKKIGIEELKKEIEKI